MKTTSARSETLETLVARGAWLQCEGYKCLYEEARRQKPVCAMALNWCYNEPWPSAANNSLINWPARPKPAYYAVQPPAAPRWRAPDWRSSPGPRANCSRPELWLLHDGPDPLPAGRIEAFLEIGRARNVPAGLGPSAARAEC